MLSTLECEPDVMERLDKAGFTVETLATATPSEVVALTNISESVAKDVVSRAKSLFLKRVQFSTGEAILESRKKVRKITTGSDALDELLGGGIETQAITEFHGAFGCGKTQICFQLAVNVQLPEEKGGLNGSVAYIDTEGTFRPERILRIAEFTGVKEPLKRIFVARAYNTHHQAILVDKIYELSKDENIRLVIVDSLTSLFRAEYVGRGTLAERQQKLNKHMHELLRLAHRINAAVVATNQVMDIPDSYGLSTVPIGGHVVAHTATYRIFLKKGKGELRIARLIDSPCLPDGEAIFRVTEGGIEDSEKEKSKRKRSGKGKNSEEQKDTVKNKESSRKSVEGVKDGELKKVRKNKKANLKNSIASTRKAVKVKG